MALICLATHAGDVPSAGSVVGNQTGTFNKTLPAYDVLTVSNNVTNAAILMPISFLNILYLPLLLLILIKLIIVNHIWVCESHKT